MHKTILFPGLKRNISFQYAIDTIPRGEHTFSSVRVKTGDLFSMMEKSNFFSSGYIFSLSSVCRYNVSAIGKPFRTRSALSKYKFLKDSTISVGVRDYKPGDRFSWIDWKATARTNNIMTKEFEQQRSHNIMIFIDRTESLYSNQSSHLLPLLSGLY